MSKKDTTPGYVYVLSNPAMPGILKIGKSIKGGRNRATELFSTGVPSPFFLEFEILVDEPFYIEKAAHDALSEKRVSGDREFFRCDPEDAITAILSEYVSYYDHTIVYADESEAVEAARELAMRTPHHVFEICHAMRFLDAEAINTAVEKRKEWQKTRSLHKGFD